MSIAAPYPRTLSRQVALAAVVLALLQAAVFALLIGAVRAADRADQRANQILAASESVADLEKSVIDAETGMRGFVITGRDLFLEPTTAARRSIPARERVTRGRLLENDALAIFDPLAADIDAYMSSFVAPLVATARRSLPRARAAIATGEGKRRVDDMRRQFTAIRTILRADAARGGRDARGAVRRAVVLGAAGTLLSILLYVLYSFYIGRKIVVPVRRVASTARRLAGGERAARVEGAEQARGELGAMARSFNQMADTLEAGHDELEAQRGELERTVEALDAQMRRVEVTSAFGEAVAAEAAFAPLAHLILDGVADAAGCDAGVLYVRDARRAGDLALTTARGVDAHALPELLQAGDGLAGRAAVEHRPVAAARGTGGFEVATRNGRARVAHELHAPLLQAGEVFGVLSLGRLADVPFTPQDIQLVSHLADQSAVALSKSVVLRELRRRDTITRAVLDAAPNPIALLDDGGHPVVANEPMRECLPLLHERPVPEVLDGGLRDEIADPRTGRVYVRYVARLDDADIGLEGRVVVLNDVTAEREAERLKDEFVALVSHELRTPLTSIVGYLELLRHDDDGAEGPGAAQRARFLTVVDRNARRLLRLVGDLLFVAQVESGKLGLHEGEVDLEAVARESIEAASPRARSGGVELALECEPLPSLRGDRDRIAQALDNLISNAIKFTPDGGRVTVTLRREENRAVVEVADTGIGIAEADIQRLFQRFFRTQRATAAAIPGVGLGLTIAQAIVHGHDGRLSVRSRDGDGTTFRIELPLHRTAEVPA